MRRLAPALVATILAAGVLASCYDAAGPGGSEPVATSAAPLHQAAVRKVAVCHAAGRADAPDFVEITIGDPAVNEHLEARGTPRAGHERDYLVTERTPCPPPASTGALRICKVGAPGIPAGTPFTFLVDGSPAIVPAGGCTTLSSYRVGTRVNVSETVPPATQLVALTLAPADAGTTDASAGTASVIVGTDLATLTFTNQSTTHGAVVICKVAGTGITPGTTASFTVTGVVDPATVAAGTGPGGTCSSPIAAPAGSVNVTETLAPNTAVQGTPLVSPIGAALGGSSTATTFTRRVLVTAGQTTTVTFTNVSTLGALVICKVAGTGIAAGTPADFTITDATNTPLADPVTVAAGTGPTGNCTAPIAVPGGDGEVRVTELLAANTAVQGTPLVSPIAAAVGGSMTATTFTRRVLVTAGQTTTVTFTNASTLGALVICKVAGTGLTIGTTADFTISDATNTPLADPVTLAAGIGPTGTCTAPIPVPGGDGEVRVTELLAPNTAVEGTPTVSPISAAVGGSMTATTFTRRVRVTAGQTTTVTFTNMSTLGAVVVCKVAGTGIAPGTPASFAITDAAGTQLASPFTLAAGAAPTGTCTAPIAVPSGEVRVTETLAPNTAVGGTPVVSPVGSSLGGSITATTFTFRMLVTAGQTSTVTFTNVAVP